MAKISLDTAVGRKRNKHNNDAVVLTTSEVGSLQPLHVINCHAGDYITVDMSQISQTSPTAVKTFGSFDLKTLAFFVPTKTVWRHWEDYRDSSADPTILAQEAPTLWCSTILKTLIGLDWSESSERYTIANTEYCTVQSIARGNLTHAQFDAQFGHAADFVVRCDNAATGTPQIGYMGAKLNAKGRMLVKVLQGLGYEFPKMLDLVGYNETQGPNLHPMFLMTYDAVPILAFARCFYDYIYPSSYVQQQGFGIFFEMNEWDFGLEIPGTSDTYFDLLCRMLFVPMTQDFFNSLWIRPNQRALGNNLSTFSKNNVASSGALNTNINLKLSASDSLTAVSQQNSSQSLTMSAYALRWLQDMSDYVIRNNIGGTRFHEWMLAHFGWVSSEQDSNRSHYLKYWDDKLNFYPVQASTSTDTQMLGQLAASGSSRGGGQLKFECKQDGYIIFVHLVVPTTAYFQGVKPWCRAIREKEQFYTPELDSVGTEPIPRHEVFYSYERMSDIDKAPFAQQDDAFGFAFRYADRYKRQTSTLNGDFRLPSRNLQLDAYHTFRDVLYNRSNLALDAQFMHADNQYNRIYAVPATQGDESSRDHIESFFVFNITRWNQMSSIGDSLPLFNRSGKEVSIDNGGTQVN